MLLFRMNNSMLTSKEGGTRVKSRSHIILILFALAMFSSEPSSAGPLKSMPFTGRMSGQTIGPDACSQGDPAYQSVVFGACASGDTCQCFYVSASASSNFTGPTSGELILNEDRSRNTGGCAAIAGELRLDPGKNGFGAKLLLTGALCSPFATGSQTLQGGFDILIDNGELGWGTWYATIGPGPKASFNCRFSGDVPPPN